jgi:hypothetical protein
MTVTLSQLRVLVEAVSWPSLAERRARILERGAAVGLDFEMRMGHRLGTLDAEDP